MWFLWCGARWVSRLDQRLHGKKYNMPTLNFASHRLLEEAASSLLLIACTKSRITVLYSIKLVNIIF